MFIFESSKDKELKGIVQKKFYQAIASEPKYQSNKVLLTSYCGDSNKKAVEKIVDLVKETIKDDDVTPKKKYYAIKMLQDVMKSQNNVLGNYVVKKILKRLVILAKYKKESKDESRGKSIFGAVKPDQEAFAKKFHLTLLSCLQQWGTTWPRGTDGPHKTFTQTYKQLVVQKVTFPKTSSANPQVLRQRVSKDKVQIKGLSQPKKFISPERPDRKQLKSGRNSGYSSQHVAKGMDQNKVIQINTLMLEIDQIFNELEQKWMEGADARELNPIVSKLDNELMKGDEIVAYLMSQNVNQYGPVINDVTSDFEFISEIKHDLQSIKTEKNKADLKRLYKQKFENRRARRHQNQLRISSVNKNLNISKQQGRISNNSRKSEDNKPNFYYPSLQNNKNSNFGKSAADSITIQDLKKRIDSNRQSERSKQNPGSSEISSDQHTGKFKTFRPQEITYSPKEEQPKKVDNKLTPRQSKSHRQSQPQSSSSQQSSSLTANNSNYPQIKYPQVTKPPVAIPTPTPQSSSSSNIHSTSIMKKVDSSNLINNSSSKQKSGFSSQNPFSGSSKQNPIQSNPFQSFESFKKPAVSSSNNMFSSFGQPNSNQSSSKQKSSFFNKQKQVGYGKIQQNKYESQDNISQRKKSQLGNPFDGESMVSMQKQKTNPFDSIVSQSINQQQFGTNNSNPFGTNKSFFQKSNPFMSDSIISKSNDVSNPFDTVKDLKEKSIIDNNNNISQSNIFGKKSGISFKFNFEDMQVDKSLSKSDLKHSIRQSDFAPANNEVKQDFFKQFQPKAVLKTQNENKSFFDEFPQAPNKPPPQLQGYFDEIKNSHILPKKQMTTSNLDFDWFNPGNKQNNNNESKQEKNLYPQFVQQEKQHTKSQINFNEFNPPEINIETDTKRSRVSNNNSVKQPSNPWPEINQLSQSEFPQTDQPEFVPQINNGYLNVPGNKQNEEIGKQSSRSRAKQNPFGIPNPQFQHSRATKTKNDDITPPYSPIQVPTTDKDQFLFEDFGVVTKQGGSPWNPFKRKTAQISPKKVKIVTKFQLSNLQSQLQQAKQFYQQQLSLNSNLKQQFITQRTSYLSKIKQLQTLSSQKQQYQNVIKKSKQLISTQQSSIAQQSKKVNQLKTLKDRKNACLKRLYELRNHQASLVRHHTTSRLTSKVNKFLAFNQTAKNLHSLAISNTNSRQHIKMNSFHHKHY